MPLTFDIRADAALLKNMVPQHIIDGITRSGIESSSYFIDAQKMREHAARFIFSRQAVLRFKMS